MDRWVRTDRCVLQVSWPWWIGTSSTLICWRASTHVHQVALAASWQPRKVCGHSGRSSLTGWWAGQRSFTWRYALSRARPSSPTWRRVTRSNTSRSRSSVKCRTSSTTDLVHRSTIFSSSPSWRTSSRWHRQRCTSSSVSMHRLPSLTLSQSINQSIS